MRLFGVWLTLFALVGLHGQEPRSEKPLVSVLAELEQTYDITFNYASDQVERITIFVYSDYPNLEVALSDIRGQTGLDFFRITDRIIGIRPNRIILCGYVRERQTNLPLPGALIQAGPIQTTSDTLGYYELEVNPGQTILIRHLGFQSQRLAWTQIPKNGNCPSTFMEAQSEQLAEVVLSDYLVYGIDHLSNGAIQLDFDRFTSLPGLINHDVFQAIQALPGIQSNSETVSEINIRGGSNDQNLILWDGIKMYQTGHFFGLISMYNPHLAHQVEVFKNGTPAAYSDGVSGVIHMKSRPEMSSRNSAVLGINLIDIHGQMERKLGKKLYMQVAGRKAIDDWLNTPTYESYLDRVTRNTELEETSSTNPETAFDFYDASLRMVFTPSKGEIWRMNFIHTSNQISFSETAAIDGQSLSRRSNLSQSSLAGGLFHSYQWSDRFRTEAQLYETDYKLKSTNANIPVEQRLLQENRVSETGWRMDAYWESTEGTHWQLGYQFVESKITNLDDVDQPRFRDLAGEVLRTHAMYTAWNLRDYREVLNLNLGFRANLLDKFDLLIWEPRLQLQFRPAQSLTIEILGEFKNQTATQVVNFQNDFLGLAKRRWRLANEDNFPVLRSRQISAGLQWSQNGWLADGVAYLKQVEGINSRTQAFLDSFQYVEAIGSYTSSGLDFLFRKQWEKTNGWISYSFLRSQYDFETLDPSSFTNTFELNHYLSAGLVFSPSDGLHIAAGANWHSGVPFTGVVEGTSVIDDTIAYSTPNASRLRDYLRVDLSASYTRRLYNHSHFKLSFAIWNILNEENEISRYYYIQDDEVRERTDQALSITPNISLEWQF